MASLLPQGENINKKSIIGYFYFQNNKKPVIICFSKNNEEKHWRIIELKSIFFFFPGIINGSDLWKSRDIPFVIAPVLSSGERRILNHKESDAKIPPVT